MYVIHDISGAYVIYCIYGTSGIYDTSYISVIYARYAPYVIYGIHGLFDMSAINGIHVESVTQAMRTSNSHIPPTKPLYRMTYMAYLSYLSYMAYMPHILLGTPKTDGAQTRSNLGHKVPRHFNTNLHR